MLLLYLWNPFSPNRLQNKYKINRVHVSRLQRHEKNGNLPDRDD